MIVIYTPNRSTTRANKYKLGTVALVAGPNRLDDGQIEALRGHPKFGCLQESGAIKLADPQSNPPREPLPKLTAEELVEIPYRDVISHIDTITDVELLLKLKELDPRVRVSGAIDNRLGQLK